MQNSVNGLQGPPKFSLKCRTFIQFPYKKRLKSLITCCLFIENWLNNSKVLHLSSERHPHCEQGGWSPINQGKKRKFICTKSFYFQQLIGDIGRDEIISLWQVLSQLFGCLFFTNIFMQFWSFYRVVLRSISVIILLRYVQL